MTKFLPLIVLAAVGCATAPPQPPLVRPTASGFAEGTFHKTTIAEIQSKFAARCAGMGRIVEDINSMQISCGVDRLGLRAETWHYSTTWTMTQSGSDVHASAGTFVGYPGGPRSPILGDNNVTNIMQNTLFQLGAD